MKHGAAARYTPGELAALAFEQGMAAFLPRVLIFADHHGIFVLIQIQHARLRRKVEQNMLLQREVVPRAYRIRHMKIKVLEHRRNLSLWINATIP